MRKCVGRKLKKQIVLRVICLNNYGICNSFDSEKMDFRFVFLIADLLNSTSLKWYSNESNIS